jgi:uncharacterized phage protein (TIGR02220 family)
VGRRIRTIKPEILEDEKTAGLSDAAFRLFTAAITLADDFGNLRGDARWLEAQVWWVAISRGELPRAAAALHELHGAGLVTVYEVGTQRYAHLSGWERHQRVDNAGKSQVPKPSDAKAREVTDLDTDNDTRGDSRRTSANDGDSRLDWNGLEGNGPSGKPDRLPGLESETPAPPPDPIRLLAETACTEINRLTGSRYQPGGAATVDLCRALWNAKHTTDEVKLVVADKYREWHGNPEMRRRLVPGTLLALKNFRRYLDELRSRPGAKPARAPPPSRPDEPPVKFFTSDDDDDEDPCPDS